MFDKKLLSLTLLFFLIVLACHADKKNKSHMLQTMMAQTNLRADETFFVKEITYKSDIPFSKEEFFYLTNIAPQTHTTLRRYTLAYEQLKRKKRFSYIDITFTDAKRTKATPKKEAQGPCKTIHITLTANWMFKDIVLDGILFGKHRYKNLYLQHPGDTFDISLHEESIDLLKKKLYEKGYFSCSISDEIIYNKKDKTIIVRIGIKKGRHFYTNKIRITTKANIDPSIMRQAEQILAIMKDRQYSKSLLNQMKKRLKKLFKKRGFTKVEITSVKKIHLKRRRIALFFTVHLGTQIQITLQGNRFFFDRPHHRKCP